MNLVFVADQKLSVTDAHDLRGQIVGVESTESYFFSNDTASELVLNEPVLCINYLMLEYTEEGAFPRSRRERASTLG